MTLTHVKIRPTSGWRALDLAQLLQHRDLFRAFAARDIKLRYRQTLLGVVWVIFQPLLAAGIFSFVFGKIAGLDKGGTNYFALSFAGMLGWNLFSSTVLKSGGSLVQNAPLLSKVFFPRLLLPLSTVAGGLLDFAISFCALLGVLAWAGLSVGWTVLTLPLWVALIIVFAAGCGIAAAALASAYRDVQHILPVLVQMLLYASPVGYAASAVPESARGWYFLNPLAPMIEGLRWSLLGMPFPPVLSLLLAIVVSAAMFVGGALLFRRMERQMADVI
jgi:lipopolysaccharide transport system permease protein